MAFHCTGFVIIILCVCVCAKYYITFGELARPDIQNTHSQCTMFQDIACLRLDPVIPAVEWITVDNEHKDQENVEIPLPVLRQAPM